MRSLVFAGAIAVTLVLSVMAEDQRAPSLTLPDSPPISNSFAMPAPSCAAPGKPAMLPLSVKSAVGRTGSMPSVRITPVRRQKGVDAPATSDSSSTAGVARPTMPSDFVFQFTQPAEFPLPSPDGLLDSPVADGAVIHEGMMFRAGDGGAFELDYLMSMPATPVTLRLQLIFMSQDGTASTVTLAPVRILPEVDRFGLFLPSTMHIQQCGIAPDISAKFKSLSIVQRQGVARFGSIPAERGF